MKRPTPIEATATTLVERELASRKIRKLFAKSVQKHGQLSTCAYSWGRGSGVRETKKAGCRGLSLVQPARGEILTVNVQQAVDRRARRASIMTAAPPSKLRVAGSGTASKLVK